MVVADVAVPSGFEDAIAETGELYRTSVAEVTSDADVVSRLRAVLGQEPGDGIAARHARILLARVEHPDVFADFAAIIQKWREGKESPQLHGIRPGLLSGIIMSFVKRGPESEYVDERVGRRMTPFGSRPDYKRVKRFTDVEVNAGIARNAAARQAILEHFLKFMEKGDAYEQCEMMEVIDQLWGRRWSSRMPTIAVIDHVQDVNALIEAVFEDASRPTLARMEAALYLADARPEVQAFMLEVVTNTPGEDGDHQREDLVNRALFYLKASGNEQALAVLRDQKNVPAWEREKIEAAIDAIERRLAEALKND